MNDIAGEIRKYLRAQTGTALNVRKAGPAGDWIDIRGTGPAGTFLPEELLVVENLLGTLGLRLSPSRDFATIPPSMIDKVLGGINGDTRSETEGPSCAGAG